MTLTLVLSDYHDFWWLQTYHQTKGHRSWKWYQQCIFKSNSFNTRSSSIWILEYWVLDPVWCRPSWNWGFPIAGFGLIILVVRCTITLPISVEKPLLKVVSNLSCALLWLLNYTASYPTHKAMSIFEHWKPLMDFAITIIVYNNLVVHNIVMRHTSNWEDYFYCLTKLTKQCKWKHTNNLAWYIQIIFNSCHREVRISTS